MNSATPPCRRTVLAAGGVGVTAATLSACGGGEYQGSKLTETPTEPENTQPAQGTELVDLAAVPVGGAVSATGPGDKPVIVAQPREGEVVAHSAVCTHMGCAVKPSGEELRCPCHGSVFRAASGDVVTGPAKRPLPEVPVHVRGSKVVTGQG